MRTKRVLSTTMEYVREPNGDWSSYTRSPDVWQNEVLLAQVRVTPEGVLVASFEPCLTTDQIEYALASLKRRAAELVPSIPPPPCDTICD